MSVAYAEPDERTTDELTVTERKEIVVAFLTGRRADNGGFLQLTDYDEAAALVNRARKSAQDYWREHREEFPEDNHARHGPRFYVTTLIIAVVYAHAGNVFDAWADLFAHQLVDCSLSTFRRAWRRQPDKVRYGARKGWKGVTSAGMYCIQSAKSVWATLYVDTHTMDVVVWYHGKRIRPYITAIIDDYSRFVGGILITPDHPTSQDIAAVFAMAMRQRTAPDGTTFGGKPGQILCDNGGENWGDFVLSGMRNLKCRLQFCLPYSPWQKGKIERWFLTVESKCISKLPGWCDRRAGTETGAPMYIGPDDELLHFDRLAEIVIRYVHYYNYEQPHSMLGGRTPIQAIMQAPAAARKNRPEPDRAALARAFLSTDKGTHIVNKLGVFVHGRYYTGDACVGRSGDTVIPRWLPTEPDRPCLVELFDVDDNYLGTLTPNKDLTKKQRRSLKAADSALTAETVEHIEHGLGIRYDRSRFTDDVEHMPSPAAIAAGRSRKKPVESRIAGSSATDQDLRSSPGYIDIDGWNLNEPETADA